MGKKEERTIVRGADPYVPPIPEDLTSVSRAELVDLQMLTAAACVAIEKLLREHGSLRENPRPGVDQTWFRQVLAAHRRAQKNATAVVHAQRLRMTLSKRDRKLRFHSAFSRVARDNLPKESLESLRAKTLEVLAADPLPELPPWLNRHAGALQRRMEHLEKTVARGDASESAQELSALRWLLAGALDAASIADFDSPGSRDPE